MPRVGFDASPLQRPHPPGITRVVAECLAALEARGQLEVVRLVPDPSSSLRRWRQWELPRRARELELTGIHSFLSAFPLRGPGRRVQTVHELPWRHGVRENSDARHRLWARLGPWRADAVVVVSQSTARDLGLRRAEQGGKLHVIPWGVGPPFGGEPAPGTVDEVLLDKYRLPDRPLVLCPGAVRAKKNLGAVLEGVSRMPKGSAHEVQVVVTGPETQQLRRDLAHAQRLGVTRQVSTPGEVPLEDLAGLMRLASVVAVLSSSEGFGLPALEALACGTPSLVPEHSAQAEAAGPGALTVQAHDPESVAAGIERALLEREGMRHALAEAARECSWDETARNVELLWESLA